MKMKNTFLLAVTALSLGACRVSEEINSSSDTSGPYINLSNYAFYTTLGREIDFSNISAYDDVDGLMDVSVKGYVNYDIAGEYYLTLYAVDTSGNETDVNVTVYVEDSEYVEADTKETETTDEEELCTKYNSNENYPCDVVISETLNEYEIIFSGNNGKNQCEELKDENSSCVVIRTNDGSFWGYGLKKNDSE